jgi:hypothetical protein
MLVRMVKIKIRKKGEKLLQGQNQGTGTQDNEQKQRTKKVECFICGDEHVIAHTKEFSVINSRHIKENKRGKEIL